MAHGRREFPIMDPIFPTFRQTPTTTFTYITQILGAVLPYAGLTLF